MRLNQPLRHLLSHSAYTNIGVDDHHDRPINIQVSNTVQVIQPLPGGPGVWDISVTLEASVVMFSFRSAHDCEPGAGGKAGVVGIATRNQLDAAAITLGGHGLPATTAYHAAYAKRAAALNLSDKIFSVGGDDIVLTDAYLTLTGPTTRVLRTTWTNYSAGNRTLDVRGQVQVIG